MAWILATAVVGLCPTFVDAAVLSVPVPFASISDAMAAAADGDEIVVSPGVYGPTVDFQGKRLRLRSVAGAELTVLDGSGRGPIVLCENVATGARIEGFTIRNAANSGAGGAVVVSGGVLEVADCIIEQNIAVNGGGAAIRVEQGGLIGDRVVIRNNVAGASVSSSIGAAVAIIDSTAALTDCALMMNTGEGIAGGAIGAVGASEVTLVRTRFERNTSIAIAGSPSSTQGGGAIAIAGFSRVTMRQCEFIANSILGAGGSAIATLDDGGSGSLIAIGCRIEENIGGSAIQFSSYGALELSACDFVNNTAGTTGIGGALAITAVHVPGVSGPISIRGCNFRGNRAAVAGAINTRGLTLVTDSTFENNAAVGGAGGSFVITGGGGAVRNFSTPEGTRYERCVFRGNRVENAAGKGGGAVRNYRGSADFVDCLFESNFADRLPGGALMFLGRLTSEPPSFSVRGCRFVNNSVVPGGRGGAIADESRIDLTVEDCEFIGNTAENGGHISLLGAQDVAILRSNFTGGGAISNAAGGGGDDGCLTITDATTIRIVGCTVQDVRAKRHGGFRLSASTSTVIADSIIRRVAAVARPDGNWGDIGAGEVGGSGIVEIRNLLIEDTSAKITAGLRLAGPGAVTIRDSVFRRCVARPAGTQGGDFGALELRAGTVLVERSSFEECSAKLGAGITAAGGGTAGNLVIRDSTFRNCLAIAGDGGAMRLSRGGSSHIDNVRIEGCLGNSGGGIFSDSVNLTVVNALITGCTGGDGAGIAARGAGILRLINATVTGCVGPGVALQSPANDFIANSIIRGNAPLDLRIESPAPTSVDARSSNIGTVSSGGTLAPGNIDADPRFVDAPGGDYRLRAGSPCIDAGDNGAIPAGITADLAGRARRLDDPATADTGTGGSPIVDLGALEFVPSRCVADLDDGTGSGVPDGAVTIEDLLFYLWAYEGGTQAADLDDGSGLGTPDGGVTIEDLVYLLARFEQGC